MKLTHVLTGMALSLVLAINGTVMAQPAPGDNQKAPKEMQKGKCPMEEGMQKGEHEQIPNLTDEQKTKIKELRIANYKETHPLQSQLGELKAKQNTLTTADKADMKAINANIDEITKVKNQLMKAEAANKQQIRSLLTDEQRMAFDRHQGFKEERSGKGKEHKEMKNEGCNHSEHGSMDKPNDQAKPPVK